MTDNETENGSPARALQMVGEQLRAGDGVDTDLAKIICDQLLIVTPAEDAVATSKAAIIKLSVSRAAAIQARKVSDDGQ